MRPNLLFLSQALPIPEGGAGIRSYNLLRIMARSFDVTVLCFYRSGAVPTSREVARGLEAVRRFAEVEVFPVEQEFSRLRLVADHARSLLRGRAYTAYAYASRPFEQRLRARLAGARYALVHLDSLDLAAYLPLLQGLPVACTHQNVESRLLRRRASMVSSPLVRRYLHYQAGLLEAEERVWCPGFRTNLVVSQDEAEELRRLVPDAHVLVAPNGVDTEFFRPQAGKDRGAVFVGPASWRPNEDAMRFFGSEVLPRVRADNGTCETTWVGRAADAKRVEFRQQFGIDMTGFVDDVRPYLRDAACFVVPLRTGGGTRLKILEAWAMGKAVVSTSVGCEGLAAEDGVNLLIRDTAAGFAEAVRTLLGEPAIRARLGRAGRETAVRLYDWEVMGRTVTEAYMLLCAACRSEGHSSKQPVIRGEDPVRHPLPPEAARA